MNISVFAKNQDTKGYSRLYLFVSINNCPGWFPTKIKVSNNCWHKLKQIIAPSEFNHKEKTAMLHKRKGQLAKVFQDLEYEGIAPTVAIVRARYNAALDHTKVIKGVHQIELLEYFDQYREDRKAIRSKGYLRQFKAVKAHLIAFKPDVRFKDITNQFYNAWISYFFDDLELENNSVSSYVKKLKSVMKVAIMDPRTREQGIPIDFMLFKDTYVKPKPIWMDWKSEVVKLENFSPRQDQVVYKDEFLFRCYTGLRHVDLFTAKPENFITRGCNVYLDFMGIKTRVDQNLMLSPKAVALYKKWNGKPPRLHQSDCNEVIKEICKDAGIDTVVEKVRYSGKERKAHLLPKHSLVTTHTARRTFGRHWMDNGGSLRNLMLYYGHSNEKQTAEYIGWTTEEVNSELMRVMA